MQEILIYLLTGAVMGVISSFFGIGGGIILMAVFYSFVPDMPPTEAIAISLGTIFLNSTQNIYLYYKQKLTPDKKTMILMLISGGFGAIVSNIIMQSLSAGVLKQFFGICLTIIILRNIVQLAKHTKIPRDVTQVPYYKAKLITIFFGGTSFANMTGLGGGLIFVPLLDSWMKLPAISISAYSNVGMSIGALVGLIGAMLHQAVREIPLGIGQVNIIVIFNIFIGSIFTAKYGVLLNSKVSQFTKNILLILIFSLFTLKIFFFS
jgi:uncharacterized membrane protein YfcA